MMTRLLSLDSLVGVRPRETATTTVRPIPCASARFVVTVDGVPYAGFDSLETAQNAIKLWMGEDEEDGLPRASRIPAGTGWAAARGRVLAILAQVGLAPNAGLSAPRRNPVAPARPLERSRSSRTR